MLNNRGSMSIEAAVALPVFLFVMLFFINVAEIYIAKAVIYEACIETAEYMAEYAYLTDRFHDEGDSISLGNLPTAGLRFQSYVDDNALLEKYVIGGKYGVSFIGSSFPDDEGFIDLKIKYFVHVDIPVLGRKSHMCSEHIRQRAYLGYRGEESADPDEDDPYVYVAKKGVVYHTSRGCTYLLPDIHSKTIKAAKSSGYKACKLCGKSCGAWVYTTPDGESYHSSRKCKGIKRTVDRYKLSEVSLPPCSKCSGGK